MGMFDHIRCRMPLPAEPAPPDVEWFQTKDTEAQHLERYTIEADGRLVHQRADVEVPYHGDIAFYEGDSKTGEWWEYVARFTDGRCVGIRLVEHKPGRKVNG